MIRTENAGVERELSELTDIYEAALVANDTEKLKQFFWNSESALRFGVAEELYGASAISEFRDKRKITFTEREVLRKTVLALGDDAGVSTLEFSVVVFGRRKHGRQTQVWARLDGGWKIVSAHVSHKVVPGGGAASDYVDAAGRLLDLEVPADHRSAVARNLEVMGKVAAPLMALDLEDDVEAAPVFQP